MSRISSEQQAVVLEQFRARLVEQDLIHDGDSIGTDDYTLLRFLRARQFDLGAATKMWANAQEWRKTVEGVGIDELYKQLDPFDFPERRAVFDCWPVYYHKTDKKGRPFSIQRYGVANVPDLYTHITPERFWIYLLTSAESVQREVVPAASEKKGEQVDGCLLLIDLKGFGLSKFWQIKNLARDGFQMAQDYYPENTSKIIIINAPSTFTMIWSALKHWLAAETIAKMDILGTGYVDALLEHVDADCLPESLGGTCKCEQFGGCEMYTVR